MRTQRIALYEKIIFINVVARHITPSVFVARTEKSMHAMQVHQFPIVESPHLATIKDKTRCSGLTSVAFIDDHTLVCADFNEKRVYLASIKNGELQIIDTHPTLITDGTAVQTDLMDLQGNRIVLSNFYQGTAGLYTLNGSKIIFETELRLKDYKGLHGVRFIPDHPNLLWLTYCGAKNKCFQVVDLETKTVIHQIDADQQCQDVAFIDNYAVVFARTDHIHRGTTKARMFSEKWRMFATAYVYRMPSDLLTEEPSLVSRWKGKGHIDAVKAHNGEIFAANQYLDRVDVFTLSASGKLSLSRTISGFTMPHGLDVRGNKLAVTNYMDSTLRIVDIA